MKDALLLAISEEYVEGVEILLLHEEQHHVPGTPHSWEAVDSVSASYTPDVTPLILAAHKNNYEILKILLDRGAKVPQPHNLRCRLEPSARRSLVHKIDVYYTNTMKGRRVGDNLQWEYGRCSACRLPTSAQV